VFISKALKTEATEDTEDTESTEDDKPLCDPGVLGG
jgi:hypothetical protein